MEYYLKISVCKMFVENRRDRRKLLFISISGDPICFKSGHQHILNYRSALNPAEMLDFLCVKVFTLFTQSFVVIKVVKSRLREMMYVWISHNRS